MNNITPKSIFLFLKNVYCKVPIILLIFLNVLLVCAALMLFVDEIYAVTITDQTPVKTVSNAEELNQALGGIHKVDNNKLILQEDVEFIDLKKLDSSNSDLTVRIDDSKDEIELDLNGKTITNKSVNGSTAFSIKKSQIKIVGGSFCCLNLSDSSQVYLDMFRLESGADVYLSDIEATSKSARSMAFHIMNENFDPEYTSNVRLEINGSKIDDDIEAYSSKFDLVLNNSNVKYIDIIPTNNDLSRNTITVHSGTIGEINACSGTSVYLDGGCVRKLLSNSTGPNLNMNGGKISDELDVSNLKLRGGTITTSVKCNTINMNGGQIVSNAGYGIKIENSYLGLSKIADGLICTTRKGATGIIVSDRARLKLMGGTIETRLKKGNKGISVTGSREYSNRIKHISRVYFKAQKGKRLKIKGYKFGYHRTKKYGKVEILPHTKLKVKRKRFFKGYQLPRSIKGDITVEYLI